MWHCVHAYSLKSLLYSSVSEIAESLLELVTDETKNGEAYVVFPKGKQYVTFLSLIKDKEFQLKYFYE